MFYRIENSKGIGPYMSDYYDFWKTHDHNNCGYTPIPTKDVWFDIFGNRVESFCIIDSIKSHNVIFAFKTLDDLYNWFSTDELAKLKKLGFEIKKIKGELFFKSSRRCIIERE